MPPVNPTISIIVAVSENGIIGRDGDMPWKLSSDLKRFKALTSGHPVVMGRKTFESIGRPLPNRTNIVVTRSKAWSAENVTIAPTLDNAIEQARESLSKPNYEIFIIGGGQIYAQAMPLADKLYITEVLAEIDGDTSFSEIGRDDFTQTHTEDVPAGEKDSHATRFVIWEKRTEAS
ncbi:MAG: dihydrofolate reductase [Pseudomonadota bacterium]